MNTTADEIRESIKTAYAQLELLADQGRIVMDTPRENEHWHDSREAAEQALRGLDLALSATMWMHTLPDETGDYPELPAR